MSEGSVGVRIGWVIGVGLLLAAGCGRKAEAPGAAAGEPTAVSEQVAPAGGGAAPVAGTAPAGEAAPVAGTAPVGEAGVVAEIQVPFEEEPPVEEIPFEHTWGEHPCKAFVDGLVATPGGGPGRSALISLATRLTSTLGSGDDTPRHIAPDTLRRLTASYAACRAAADASAERCKDVWSSAPNLCDQAVSLHQVAIAAHEKGGCMARVGGFPEVQAEPEVWARYCAVVDGDAAACATFAEEDRWVCKIVISRDVADCAGLTDPHLKRDCTVQVAMFRAVAGLPQQSEIAGSEEADKIMLRRLIEPGFDCDAWLDGEMRRACR